MGLIGSKKMKLQDEKILIDKDFRGDVFFPSINGILYDLLGLKTIRSLLSLIPELSVPVSKRTLDNLHSVGITEKTFHKFILAIIKELDAIDTINFEKFYDLEKNKKIPIFKLAYYSFLPFFHIADKLLDKKNYYDFYLFIDKRQNIIEETISKLKHIDQSDSVINYYKQILTNTKLTKLEQNNVLFIMKDGENYRGELTDIVKFHLDFYMEIIALIENQEAIIKKYGKNIFLEILQKDGNSLFYKLICFLKNKNKLKTNELINKIPIRRMNNNNQSTPFEIKKNKFYKWKKKEVIPKLITMYEFIGNIDWENRGYLFMLSIIIFGLDQKVPHKDKVENVLCVDFYKRYIN